MDQTEMAFEFARDLAKQLLTLSTAILGLTITFTKDLLTKIPHRKLWLLKAAWISYLITIIFGIFTLQALTGTLDDPTNRNESKYVSEEKINPQINHNLDETMSAKLENNELKIKISAKIYGGVQIVCFLTATTLVIVYGITGLKKREEALEVQDSKK